VNRVATATAGPTRIVTMDTLDHALAGERPSLLKLDVEGFEGEVIRGAAETLSNSELKAVITEDRSPPVADILQGLGFVEQSYDPFTRHLQRAREGHRHNALFVRDKDFVQQRLSNATRVKVLNKWV
jgi:Methyltransferase FkbM domain